MCISRLYYIDLQMTMGLQEEQGRQGRRHGGGHMPPPPPPSPQGNSSPGRNPRPRAMQYNRIPANLFESYSSTGLQFSTVHWPNSLETPKIFSRSLV